MKQVAIIFMMTTENELSQHELKVSIVLVISNADGRECLFHASLDLDWTFFKSVK